MLFKFAVSIACATLPGAVVLPALADEIDFKNHLQHADVVLMPGWENQNVGNAAPLHPKIVAWGEDAVWGTAERKRNAQKYRAMGVNLIAANVWMLTATKEKLAQSQALQDASCRDIAGDKLIPPWLDDGQSYWGCTNQAAFRAQLRQRVRDGMLAGANLLHLDDHLGTVAATAHGGCFCDACMEGFNHWLAQNISPAQLKALGVRELVHFSYRDYLHDLGVKTRADYLARQANLPLQQEYLQFQRAAINDFVQELKTLAEKTHGSYVPLGINAWNLVPSQLANAHLADYFSNEIKHYGVEASHPPFAYKLADALGKPVFATAAGEGWSHINHRKQTQRVRQWLAMSYVFGHQFMYAFKQWAFDPERGTNWYEPTIEEYAPVTDFVTQHSDLFNDYEALAPVALLYNAVAERSDEQPLRRYVEQWHRQSLQFRLLAAGDNVLKTRLKPGDIAGLAFVCRIDNSDLVDQQNSVFEAWQKAGKAGKCDALPQPENYRIAVRDRNQKDLPGVWALARVHNSRPPVVHLLNQNFDDRGAPQPHSEITVALPSPLLGRVSAVHLHRPQRSSVTLNVLTTPQGPQVTVPELEYWAVLQLQR